jgi:DNA-binding NarL/FixJ family response regulator
MVRAGIRAMLAASTATLRADIEEAETTEEAIARCSTGAFDIVLMDFHLPGRGGPKATEMILQKRPGVRILCLSSYDERSYVDSMMAAGASGYILKNVEPDTLVSAIKTVMAGKFFYSNEIALKLLEPRPVRTGPGESALLSAREKEVFKLILSGLKDREVAEKMGIAKRTVDKHRQNLMAKLNARNAVELVQAAVRMGWVKSPK